MNSFGNSSLRKVIPDVDKFAFDIFIEPERSVLVAPPWVIPDTSDARAPYATEDRWFTNEPIDTHRYTELGTLLPLMEERVRLLATPNTLGSQIHPGLRPVKPELALSQDVATSPITPKSFIDIATSPRTQKKVPKEKPKVEQSNAERVRRGAPFTDEEMSPRVGKLRIQIPNETDNFITTITKD